MVALHYAGTALARPAGLGRRVLTLALLLNLALVAVMAVLDMRFGVSYHHLVADANSVAQQPAYVGAYTYFGVLMWAAGSAVALFAASVLDRGSAVRPVLAAGGAFMAIAGLDDLYLLHENAWRIGLSEAIVTAMHAALFGAFLWLASRAWRGTPWVLLAAAVAGLAVSAAMDLFEGLHLHAYATGQILIEEASKVTAASFLAAYLILTARGALAARAGA